MCGRHGRGRSTAPEAALPADYVDAVVQTIWRPVERATRDSDAPALPWHRTKPAGSPWFLKRPSSRLQATWKRRSESDRPPNKNLFRGRLRAEQLARRLHSYASRWTSMLRCPRWTSIWGWNGSRRRPPSRRVRPTQSRAAAAASDQLAHLIDIGHLSALGAPG